MDKYNWRGFFPNTPENFHKRVEDTLNSLPIKEERCSMEKRKKKMSLKKAVIIAAAAVFVLGTTAFAAGKIVFISGHSSSKPTYTSIPPKEELQSTLGFTPKLEGEFTNGYVFNGARVIENEATGENGESLKIYKGISAEYKKYNDSIAVYMEPRLTLEQDKNADLAESYNGIDLYYSTYANKCVAGDYVMTEQDKADQESGKYVFSYGIEKENPIQVQNLVWTDGEVQYDILAMDSELTKEDLVIMAKEIIE